VYSCHIQIGPKRSLTKRPTPTQHNTQVEPAKWPSTNKVDNPLATCHWPAAAYDECVNMSECMSG